MIAIAFTATVATPAALSEVTDEALIERGRKQFIRCAGCHTLQVGEQAADFGPHLDNLIHRESGSLSDFLYTDDMPDPPIIWTEAMLDQWLHKPQQLIPGMCMPFRGISNPELRRALILYVKRGPQ